MHQFLPFVCSQTYQWMKQAVDELHYWAAEDRNIGCTLCLWFQICYLKHSATETS